MSVDVGNDEGALAVQHNPNRPERLGMHQISDVIDDHRTELRRPVWQGQDGTYEC